MLGKNETDILQLNFNFLTVNITLVVLLVSEANSLWNKKNLQVKTAVDFTSIVSTIVSAYYKVTF